MLSRTKQEKSLINNFGLIFVVKNLSILAKMGTVEVGSPSMDAADLAIHESGPLICCPRRVE